jgi:uncharacterized protein YbbC (DUF1343 family)
MVTTGLEILLRKSDCFQNRNIGLIVNQSSVTPDLHYSWNILKERGIRINVIFSPEHGLFAT